VESVAVIAEKILRLRQQQRLSKDLLTFFEREQQTYRLPSNLVYTLPLIDALTARLQPLGICTRAELKNVRLALDEALVNAIVHGNLEISSEMKGSTLAELVQYDDEVRRRSTQEPYSRRKVTVESLIDRTSAQFSVQDEGPGFDHRSLPEDFSETDNLASHGRGLLLIKTFMDRIIFNDSGNRITLIKTAPRRPT
jgi:anti-sigma regulatory factor (Ser/Thr protein kinase)